MNCKIFVINIGNIPIGFILKNRAMGLRIQKRYKGYIKAVKPVFQFKCSFSSEKNFSDSEEVILNQFEEDKWKVYRKDFTGIWNVDNGTVSMRPSIYSFDAFLRVVYSIFMPGMKGLLLHSSCIVIQKKAYVFMGPSGSGKTTVARNAGRNIVLNDEICAVFIDSAKRGVCVRGTPFWGEMGTGPVVQNSYPLQGLFFLRKNTFCRIKAVSHEKALQKILQCACLYGDNMIIQQDILDICIEIVKQSKAYILDFENNSNFLRTVSHND